MIANRCGNISHVLITNLIIICLLLGTSGCVVLKPAYQEPSHDLANGVVEYRQPVFEKKVTWFGWLSYLAGTGAGAYGGYKSRVALPWDADSGNTVKPVGNAVIGGLASLIATGIITSVFSGSVPDVTADNAARWWDKLDNDLILLRDSTATGKLDRIRGIKSASDATFRIHTPADARMFAHVFSASPYTDSVVAAAAGTIPRDSLPILAEIFSEPRLQGSIYGKYVSRSATLAEAKAAATMYPQFAADAEERAAALVQSLDAAGRFMLAFPGSRYKDQIGERLYSSLKSDSIPKFIDLFPSYSQIAALKQKLLDSRTTEAGVADLVGKYPDMLSSSEPKAYALAGDVADYNLYLTTFPNGASRAVIEQKLSEAMKIPENLGPAINTGYSDIGPVISPDGRTLYFDRKYDRDNTGGSDDPDEAWYSTCDSTGRWLEAINLGRPINSSGPDAVNSVTPDGNTLLVGGSPGAVAALSHRIASGWSEPEDLNVDNYYNLNEYYSVFLSNDSKTLIMSIEQRDSHGDLDLYVSFSKADASWTAPINLGARINTTGTEIAPFLASDGKTLYYSSDGLKGGYGAGDIWMARRLDDTWRNWSKPVNLGPPVNTEGSESGFFLPASGEYAYYTSNTSGYGRSDIFRVALPQAMRPNPVVLVSGIVTDKKTGNPVAATIIYERLIDGKEVGRARSEPTGGGYKIALPAGANYGFRAEAGGYVAVNDNLDLTQLRSYEEQKHDLYLVPLEVGQTVRLNNLFFDVGKSILRAESFSELNRIAALMKDNPGLEVEIQGHTDNVGSDPDNQVLSEGRANAVAAYLESRGISRARMTVKGYGAARPVVANDSDAGRRQNRRVEFAILKK